MHNEMFEVPQQPGLRYGTRPGRSDSDHEITTAVPTGWYPDARTTVQAPYDRAADQAGATGYVPDAFAFGTMFAGAEKIDQHPMMHVSATLTASDANPRRTGTRDPLLSGPARPDTLLISVFDYRGAGTCRTSYMDVPDGRRFPAYGSQDGSSWTYYEDPAAAVAPYDPSGSPVPADRSISPTAQPTWRKLAPGPTHGWTSVPAVNNKAADNAKTGKLRQQKSPHQDRRANNTYAGQTYSQATAPVSQRIQGEVNDPWREYG